MTFTNTPALLAEALATRGYTEFTPVQAAVVEAEAIGRDLIVSAQTGSGKTVAFGLAMAQAICDEEGRVLPTNAPLALIIAPTRELAMQVSRELAWLYAGTGARVLTCVGGMNPSIERRALAQGAHVIVGTPGRLRDHLERGAMELHGLKAVVLDEADEMLDMGFREDLEELLDATPEGRRTLLFSATMPKPIVALARRYQRDALRISTVGEERGHGDISYQAMAIAPADIESVAVNLLRYYEADTAMLFCATRDNVRHLHASLTERGFAVVALSGEHSQGERNQALQALRDRRARVCVATDVAARGIDLPSLSLVIHVEIPRDAEVLQHRSGRTGRAGKKGTAILLVPYPRRRRVEGMLRSAQIAAEWIDPPTAEAIRRADSERLLEKLLAPAEVHDEDRELAAMLLEKRSPEEIAAALVHMHRSAMPEPEELVSADAPRPTGPRPGFEGSAWFRLNCGRSQNADARWVLPLLCRRGHVSRSEIGAIRITANETLFEVPQAVAARFLEAVVRTAGDGDDGVEITQVDGPPREAAREHRRERSHDGPPPRQHVSAPRQRDAAPAGRTYVARTPSESAQSVRAAPPAERTAEQPAQPRKALTARPHEPRPAGHKPGGPKYGGPKPGGSKYGAPKRGGPTKPGGPKGKWGKPDRGR